MYDYEINGTTYQVRIKDKMVFVFKNDKPAFYIPPGTDVNDFVKGDNLAIGCECVPLDKGGSNLLTEVKKLLKIAETTENTDFPQP